MPDNLFINEVGKLYKTRDGRKAYCYIFQEKTDLENSFFDFVVDNYGCFSTTADGKHFFNEDKKSNFDIIGYWDE